MKTVIIILLNINFLLMSCSTPKNTFSEKPTHEQPSQVIHQIELEEITLGSRRMVILSPQTTKIEVDRNIELEKMNLSDWYAYEKMIHKIGLEKLANYPSPTTDRYFDGARAATIRIITKDSVYTSQTFDAGTPPKELSPLYQKMVLSFKEKN